MARASHAFRHWSVIEGIADLPVGWLLDPTVAERSHKVTVRREDVWINPEYFRMES